MHNRSVCQCRNSQTYDTRTVQIILMPLIHSLSVLVYSVCCMGGRVVGNVSWQLGRAAAADADTGHEVDTETVLLTQICAVVERLVDDEWRLLRHIETDIVSAGLANWYVLVATANASLSAHAALQRALVDVTRPLHDTTLLAQHCNVAMAQLHVRRQPTYDLPLLAELRSQVFNARLDQLTGVDDLRQDDDDDDDDGAVRKIISDEVDRVIKQQVDAVRDNMDDCNVMTLAMLSAALQRQHRAHSVVRAMVDTITDQLCTSAVDAVQRLTSTSSSSSQLAARWLSHLSASTLITKV